MRKIRMLAAVLIFGIGGLSFGADGPKPVPLEDQVKILQLQVETLQKLLKLTDDSAAAYRKATDEQIDLLSQGLKLATQELEKTDKRLKALEAKLPARGR